MSYLYDLLVPEQLAKKKHVNKKKNEYKLD